MAIDLPLFETVQTTGKPVEMGFWRNLPGEVAGAADCDLTLAPFYVVETKGLINDFDDRRP
jgi:hypothetical protein